MYTTIFAFEESPHQAGELWAGTDDGNIQMTSDDGGSWTMAGALPGVPARSFINDMEASLHDAGGVFAAADAPVYLPGAPFLFGAFLVLSIIPLVLRADPAPRHRQ